MTGFRILPLALIAPASVLLPAFELLAALAVLIGPRPYRRAGALILGLLLAVFMLAAAQGLARGLDFECGCFGAGDGRKPGLLYFLEDGIMFLMAAFIFIKDVKAQQDNLSNT
jgi:hypothetical protein